MGGHVGVCVWVCLYVCVLIWGIQVNRYAIVLARDIQVDNIVG